MDQSESIPLNPANESIQTAKIDKIDVIPCGDISVQSSAWPMQLMANHNHDKME